MGGYRTVILFKMVQEDLSEERIVKGKRRRHTDI